MSVVTTFAMDHIIQVQNLSYRYPDGTVALENVSFSLARGDRLGILGPNGAGKSTLLLLLAGLIFGDGEITIAGEALSRSSARRLRRQVGIVFQDPDDQLFMPTVLDDVMFGPRNQGLDYDEAQRRAMEALEAMGVADLADRPPHHLSVGQKRRVAIAGVLAMRPAILALDEPGAGLDPRGRGMLTRLLSNLDVTLIVATHDMALASRLCTTAAVLKDGRLFFFGPIDRLLADHQLLRRADLTEE